MILAQRIGKLNFCDYNLCEKNFSRVPSSSEGSALPLIFEQLHQRSKLSRIIEWKYSMCAFIAGVSIRVTISSYVSRRRCRKSHFSIKYKSTVIQELNRRLPPTKHLSSPPRVEPRRSSALSYVFHF